MGASQSRGKTPQSTVESGHNEENESRTQDSGDDDGYAGLNAIRKACHELYADQGNHLVAAATLKSWFGGPDPLDYVEMYSNSGDPDRGVPPHWHYVTCGFSDLHGDGRVHRFSGPGQESGFGFELTLRLYKKDDEQYPPMWPTGLFNRLARYVFQTGSILHVGDHIPWNRPLDGQEDSQSIIQHLLVAKDPQLPDVIGPFGNVDFRQVVGITEDEMKAAQQWRGTGVLDLMRGVSQISPYLITDPDRSKSIFGMDKKLMGRVNEGIERDGSDLGTLTSECRWTEINASEEEERKTDNDDTRQLEGVDLVFAREAADLLPVVVRIDSLRLLDSSPPTPPNGL